MSDTKAAYMFPNATRLEIDWLTGPTIGVVLKHIDETTSMSTTMVLDEAACAFVSHVLKNSITDQKEEKGDLRDSEYALYKKLEKKLIKKFDL